MSQASTHSTSADQKPANYNPFRLGLSPAWLSKAIEKTLSLDILANYYDQRPQANTSVPQENVDGFIDHTLTSVGASLSLTNPDAMSKIPSEGPVIFVANHPFGGVEGVLMSQMLRKARPDLKVLTNELLSRIPEFADLFVGVDVLSDNAAKENAKGVRAIVKHLRKGGALLIYPAGRVSALEVSNFKIRDIQWNAMVGRLMQQFDATCVPFFVHGKNSLLFYLSGLIHRRLRTAMLPRELAKNSNKKVEITVGEPIKAKDIQGLKDETEVTRYLRAATDLLAQRSRPDDDRSGILPPLDYKTKSEAEVSAIQKNLTKIDDFCLHRYKQFSVYCAPFEKLDVMMPYIAYARERTFRLAGEGTGLSTDSDHYDYHYLHLFIWDDEQSEIVGGYRLGEAKKIITEHGVNGLYSRSLYKYGENFLDNLDGALEMGRSFVTPEYQKSPKALDLLWRGIGAFVVKNPQYATLYGCVSISQEHSNYARAFLKESLMHSFRVKQEYLHDVKPLAPIKIKQAVWSKDVLNSLRNIVLINKLLGQCDPGKSIPVLLRQYLALNGRFAGFSINREFNDSLDGLIFVDLREMPAKYIQRYLGKEGSQIFANYWGVSVDAA